VTVNESSVFRIICVNGSCFDVDMNVVSGTGTGENV
jgi:hypothetical protein